MNKEMSTLELLQKTINIQQGKEKTFDNNNTSFDDIFKKFVNVPKEEKK